MRKPVTYLCPGDTVVKMMSKLYVGNLPTDVNEGTLRQLFSEQGVSATNVLVKRGGYAFVDCQDQTGIDRAIQELNGTY